jgi:epoxyqueuosine reductase
VTVDNAGTARTVDVAELKRRAAALGFDACGVAAAANYPELDFLAEWLDRGYAGEMHYMQKSADRRADIRAVLPSARCVISLGTIYNVARPYSTENADPRQAAIARYAWGDDYHLVIQQRMESLVSWLRDQAGPGFEARAYVDTGPVQERVFAQYAGLGWIGKNTCLINEEHGSWLFLSEIVCNLPLAPDEPALDQCGECTLCIEACPTGALAEPYALDARRCLSYLTIELKGPIPDEYRASIGSHAYGCDICQEVCPWNLSPAIPRSDDRAWAPRDGLDAPALLDLWNRTDDGLRALLKGSAMKRAGVRRLRRNLAVAIGNSGDEESIRALAAQQASTCQDPLVREHVEWAARLAALARGRPAQQQDPDGEGH